MLGFHVDDVEVVSACGVTIWQFPFGWFPLCRTSLCRALSKGATDPLKRKHLYGCRSCRLPLFALAPCAPGLLP